MQVDANVSESDIGKVKVGEDGSFTVNAFPGRKLHRQGEPGAPGPAIGAERHHL